MSSYPFSLKCLPPTRRGSDIPLFDDLVEFTVGELGLDLPLEPPEGGDVGDVSGFVSRTGSASEDDGPKVASLSDLAVLSRDGIAQPLDHSVPGVDGANAAAHSTEGDNLPEILA